MKYHPFPMYHKEDNCMETTILKTLQGSKKKVGTGGTAIIIR